MRVTFIIGLGSLCVVTGCFVTGCYDDKQGTVVRLDGFAPGDDIGIGADASDVAQPTGGGDSWMPTLSDTSQPTLGGDTGTVGPDGDGGPSSALCLSFAPTKQQAGARYVDLGRVTLGQSKEKGVEITNCGTVDLTALSVSLEGDEQIALVTTPPLDVLTAGQSTTVVVRFTPDVAHTLVGCDLAGEWTAQAVLAVSAAETADQVALRGVSTSAPTAELCAQSITRLVPEPSVARDPIVLQWSSANENFCPYVVGWLPADFARGADGMYVLMEEDQDAFTGTYWPSRSGLFTFQAQGVIRTDTGGLECPWVRITQEVDPLDGFAARLTWTHAGATVPDPSADARLELHLARVDPFAPTATPPWSSTVWDAWPTSGHLEFGDAEVNAWPQTEPLRSIAVAEFLPAGQAYAVGVKSLTWEPLPGEAAPVEATATLEIWIRGTKESSQSFVIAPGELHPGVRVDWKAGNGGAPFALTPL